MFHIVHLDRSPPDFWWLRFSDSIYFGRIVMHV